MKYSYTVKLGERKVLGSGSVKYPLKVKCDEKDKLIVDTTYTVSKRQEENLESMVQKFAEKKAKEFEESKDLDHSNKEISI